MNKTYGKLKIIKNVDGELFWEITEMPPHVVIKLKHIFSKITPSAKQPFLLKATDETSCDLDWFMKRYPLETSDDNFELLVKKSDDFVKFQEYNMTLLEGNYEAPTDVGFKDGHELSEFQGVAVTLFHRVKRLLIADEVGLGKTVEAIGALMNVKTLPALVVVQAHLPDQWIAEINKFTKLSCHAIKPKKTYKLLKSIDVIVVKYTNISDWMDVLLEYGFKTMILDEVQEVRGMETLKHKACKALADTMEYVMGLSGTPLVNYGDETFSIFTVINPEIFPDWDEFNREWLSWREVKDPDALGAYLKERCAYIRRTKEEVGYQLKKPNKIIHTVGYDSEAMEKMQNRAKVLAHSVLKGAFIERGQASRELSIMIRKATGVSKARYIAEYVKMILASGEKVLLGVWHREVYDILMEELKEYNPVMYSGSETLSKKNKSKEAFVNGDSQIMLISLRSGVGLDGLQHVCKYVVIGELDWTGAMHEQLIGRLYRRGQEEQVNAIFLVSDSGSDPVVMDIIGVKKSQHDGILNPFGKKEKTKSDDTIIKKLAEQYANAG